jgi:M6 family metalloprotease-like protein
MDEALAYLESRMDLSQFDSDNNDIIDAVVMINTLDIDYDVDMQWAYRYWNIYTDDDGYYYEYDGVSANDYLWASYAFMHEDEDGEFTDKSALNTYTYIHEFGHVLGADDYYDTAYNGGAPMDGCDIMDSMLGDHNAYSKFNYGWLTTSRLIVADSMVTVTLEDFSKNGDTIIIANNWNDKLGAYQEYFVLVYYKNTGLNEGAGGYFDDEGVVVYHVNATLTSEVYDGETYYDVANNNTSVDGSDGYGTTNNLIELVSNGKGGYVFKKGYSLSSTTKTDSGKKIAYTFTVDEVADDKVTITFKKNS